MTSDLAQWYGEQGGVRQVDLVQDVRSRASAVLHVESIVIHVTRRLMQPRGRFEVDQPFLAALYLAEQVVKTFVDRREGAVKLVSLACFEKVMTEAERAVRRLLLQRLAGVVEVVGFENFQEAAFTAFLSEEDAAFVAVADEVLAENNEHELMQEMLRGFICEVVQGKAATVVAVLYGIQVKGKRIMAFTLRANAGAVQGDWRQGYQQIFAFMNESAAEAEPEPVLSFEEAWSTVLEEFQEDEDFDEEVFTQLKFIASCAQVARTLLLEDSVKYRAIRTLEGERDWPELFGSEGVAVQVCNAVLEKMVSADLALEDVIDLRLLRTVAFLKLKDASAAIPRPKIDTLPVPAGATECPALTRVEDMAAWRCVASQPLAVVEALRSLSTDAGSQHYWSSETPFDAIATIDEAAMVVEYHKDKDERPDPRFASLPTEKRLARIKAWETKRKQRETAKLHAYAKSLTGHDKLHYPIVVDQQSGAAKQGAPQQVKLSSKSQAIIEKNKEKQEAKKEAKDESQLEVLMEKVAKMEAPETAAAGTGLSGFRYLEKQLLEVCCGLSRVVDAFEGFPGVTSMLKTRQAQVKVLSSVARSLRKGIKLIWRSAAESDEQQHAARVLVARILKYAATFVKEFGAEIDGKAISRVQELLLTVGLKGVSKAVFSEWAEATEKAEEAAVAAAAAAKKDKKKKEEAPTVATEVAEFYIKAKKVEVLLENMTGADERMFELFYLSADLERPTGKHKDERVMFRPDDWQRKLLDIVDAKESALVCAPTASGKTFICYYAIEQVLRSDNESVAVYIAPSKALLNQVEAEIYARFSSKKYPSNSSMELSGVFGFDRSKNVENCQVLVTLPEMMEKLLTSPVYLEKIVKRIKYVILDEVHCIGDVEGGVNWERVISMLPCPFIALSATVGNPEGFRDWLASLAAATPSGASTPVHLIEYKERFNDILKTVYSSGGVRPVHPVLCVAFAEVKNDVVSQDLVLTPAETAELYVAMRATLLGGVAMKAETRETVETLLDSLAPEVFFRDCGALMTKRQFRWYEKTTKSTLVHLAATGVLGETDYERMRALMKEKHGRRLGNAEDINRVWRTMTGGAVKPIKEEANEEETLDTRKSGKSLLELLRRLDEATLLPSILFDFDREEINAMAASLVQRLKKLQYAKYHGSEERSYRTKQENKKRTEQYEALLARRELMLKKKKTEEDYDETEITDDVPAPPLMVEEEYDAEFSFVGVRALSDPENEQMIEDLKWGKKVADDLIEGLRRGIGIHHEGCNSKYRRAVEILYRRGYLRVVIATGTLALGINMPCKSTVFCGASIDLNGLMFKQMSGRAGRRGFDLLGTVVFVDMQWPEIAQVLTADVSKLSGDFACTPTTVLRVLQLWDEVMAAPIAPSPFASRQLVRCTQSLVFRGFLEKTLGISASTTLTNFRFTLELLMKLKMVTPGGHMQGLGSLVAALADFEPSGLTVAWLLASGKLAALIKRWRVDEANDKSGDFKNTCSYRLLEILARYCLVKPQLHNSKASAMAELPKEYDVPTTKAFNAIAVENAVQQLKFLANTSDVAEGLPLSGSLPAPKTTKADLADLKQTLEKQRLQTKARHPLAATAGKDDDEFESIEELFFEASDAGKALVDFATVPHISQNETSTYVLDFFVHGKLRRLVDENLMSATLAWKVIDEWKSFLSTLTSALEKGGLAARVETQAIKALHQELEVKLKAENA